MQRLSEEKLEPISELITIESNERVRHNLIETTVEEISLGANVFQRILGFFAKLYADIDPQRQ